MAKKKSKKKNPSTRSIKQNSNEKENLPTMTVALRATSTGKNPRKTNLA